MGTTRNIRAFAALSMFTLLEACAALPAPDPAGTLYGTASSRAVITAQQLESANVTTMQEALFRLRPSLFTHRAAFAVSDQYRGYPVLYVDGRLQGGLDLLNTIPLNAVRSVQILSGNEAHARFGRYHAGGVLEVNIRR